MSEIVFFHLLNDYSGSVRVLSSVIRGLPGNRRKVLYTSYGPGALDGTGAEMHHFRYRFTNNKLLLIFRFFRVQFVLFLKALDYRKKPGTIFYINTILPVGAALAGKLTGVKVIYHYHENAWIKGPHYRLLSRLMQRLADEIICVSRYQASYLERTDGVTVVPNALDESFIDNASAGRDEDKFSLQTVVMLSSLRKYKGTDTFVKLATALPRYNFVLVLNEDWQSVSRYAEEMAADKLCNLTVLPRQRDVAAIYRRASLVTNLTDSDIAVETFGMTALEAMAFGLPVIVPEVGGIAELVEDGVNGYRIDSHDTQRLCSAISSILSDRGLYDGLSASAYERASEYNMDNMINLIEDIIEG